jgi:peptidoglycan hydrolase-like protein with peptidoglycan-binding domain
MIFTFAIQADEDPSDRYIRCLEELLADRPNGISDTVEKDRLASFLNISTDPSHVVGIINGKPVTSVAFWKTNCAMTQHAALAWCGRVERPYINGEPIAGYVDLKEGDAYWVDNDGKNVPNGPVLAYVMPSVGLNFDHLAGLGKQLPDGSYESYEGGGGDGTHIGKSTRFLDRPDRFGRKIKGWWVIRPLLPDSPSSAPETEEHPADDTIETHTNPGANSEPVFDLTTTKGLQDGLLYLSNRMHKPEFNPLGDDGISSVDLTNAISHFQSYANLPITGVADGTTTGTLERAISIVSPSTKPPSTIPSP